MAIFNKRKNDGIAAIKAEVEQLRERKTTIEAKLAEAQTAITTAHDARRRMLLGADLADEAAIARHDEACHAAESRLVGLEDALVAVGAQIEDTEQRLDGVRDKVAREAESRTRIEQMIAIQAAVKDFEAAAQKLSCALAPVDAVAIDAQRVAMITAATGIDIAAATRAVVAEVEHYISNVVKHASFSMRPQPAPRVEPPAPPPMPPVERVVCYTLERVKWIEADGTTRCAPQYTQVSVPAALVERACRANLIDLLDSPRALRVRELHGVAYGPVSEQDCADLETGGPPSGVVAEVVEAGVPGAPEVTIGAPRTMEIAVDRI